MSEDTSSTAELADIRLETEKCKLERERLELQHARVQPTFLQKNWQAVTSVAVSVAAVAVSVGQYYSSRSVQRQEYAIRRVETFEKLLPDLASPDRRDAALLLLDRSKLMEPDEVASLAATLKATRVLADLSTAGNTQAGQYQRSLNEKLARLVGGVFSDEKG